MTVRSPHDAVQTFAPPRRAELRVTAVEPLFVGRFLLVRVRTDAGITGIGEAGAWGFYEASAAAIRKIADYLVGQDPLRIEHHWQYVSRFSHYRGAVIMSAISAIDIALWDILGKALDAPIHQLLGGHVRTRARVYTHVMSPTKAALIEGVRRARRDGFTAVGHLTPFLDEPREAPFFQTHAGKIADAVRTVAAYREAAGEEVDLCIELHRRLSPAEALVLARALEPYRPMFLEDPVTPDNFDTMAEVAAKSPLPIATGERLHNLQEFEMLLKRGGCHYIRPSVGLAGGITGVRKIAALAEAHNVGVVPHNPFSPVLTAASLQIAAACPNFVIQELPNGEEEGPKRAIVREPLRCEGGFLTLPGGPGLGIELVDDPAAAWPPVPRPIRTRLNRDGAVVDQ